jgi:hypothetical protein
MIPNTLPNYVELAYNFWMNEIKIHRLHDMFNDFINDKDLYYLCYYLKLGINDYNFLIYHILKIHSMEEDLTRDNCEVLAEKYTFKIHDIEAYVKEHCLDILKLEDEAMYHDDNFYMTATRISIIKYFQDLDDQMK